MRNFIKVAVVLIAITMIFSSCSPSYAHSNNGVIVTTSLEGKDPLVGNIPCTFPLSTKGDTLNILSCAHKDIPYDDLYVWNKYEEMTGVKVNWTNVEKGERSEAVYTSLTNKQNLDLIMRCKISSEKLTQYGENGLIMDLNKDGMLEKYAPNCWAYLKSHPDALASITNPGGAIYSLPQVNSGAELRVSLKIFVNKKWLKNVGMELPKTTDEFYKLLKAFKEQDANGNGDPNDEIPFSTADLASARQALYGAFGLQNRGAHNTIVDCDPDTGKTRLIAGADEYKDYLSYMNKLYTEGLLDNRVFTIDPEQWRSNAADNLIGVFASTNLASLTAEDAENWVAIDEALEGPNGDKLWSPIRANFHSTGAAVIPTTCKNPELVLKWLDYFWTDEGTLFYHMGIEGETFQQNEYGTYDYVSRIYDEMKAENESFDNTVAKYSPYPGGSNPTVEIAPYFMGGEMATVPASAARSLFKYGPEEYWPSFTFTKAENDKLSSINKDIGKYSTEMEMEFITGIKPLSDWDSYKAQLDKLGKVDMLNIYQTAVDRYHTLTNK